MVKHIMHPEESPLVFKSGKMRGSDITHLLPFLKNTNIKIIEKGDKVFVRKNINGTWYESLFENDFSFFKDMIKIRKGTNFSSLDRSFKPKEEDWESVRRYGSMVYMFITRKCNSNCKVCFADEFLKPEEMDVNDIKYILYKIGKNKKVMLFGLEPTTRNDIFKIIKLIEKSGNIPTIFTNGLKLSNSSYVRKLKESGLKEVFLSFEGFEDVYKKLGEEDKYYLKIKAIENLKKYKIFTFLAPIVMENINEDKILDLIPFLVENKDFLKGLFLVPLSPFGRLEITQKKFFTYSDVFKRIFLSKHVKCDEKYFFEFERFKLNLHNFLRKFGKYIPTGSQIINIPFKIENNFLKEAIATEDLKRINLYFENGNFLGLIKYFPLFFSFWKLLINSTKVYYETLGEDFVYITLYQITTDFNYIPFWTHSVGLIKQKNSKGQKNLMFNCI